MIFHLLDAFCCPNVAYHNELQEHVDDKHNINASVEYEANVWITDVREERDFPRCKNANVDQRDGNQGVPSLHTCAIRRDEKPRAALLVVQIDNLDIGFSIRGCEHSWVERFDRRGTEPFELFRSEFRSEFVQNSAILARKI